MNITDNLKKPEFSFSQPAVYQIKVLGKVPQYWSDRLSGMIITYNETKGEVTTSLIGKMSDQSALSGVLNALYDLHMSVISVKKMKE